jgi:glycosyltransferase involved in cell wall biosynthesis
VKGERARGGDPPPKISVVVPSRPHESIEPTLHSLVRQTLQDFELILVVDWQLRGAPWARNRGAELARGDYVLFSDNDLEWEPDALECMLETLERGRKQGVDQHGLRVGYAYPAYLETHVPGRWRKFKSSTRGPIGDLDWDWSELQHGNFIHTSSLIAREHVIDFDPEIERLQDWDVWLRLALKHGVKGIATRRVLFKTRYRDGITHGAKLSYTEAKEKVRRKHGLVAARHHEPR